MHPVQIIARFTGSNKLEYTYSTLPKLKPPLGPVGTYSHTSFFAGNTWWPFLLVLRLYFWGTLQQLLDWTESVFSLCPEWNKRPSPSPYDYLLSRSSHTHLLNRNYIVNLILKLEVLLTPGHLSFFFCIDNRNKIKMMVGYSCNNMPKQNGRRDISNQINSSANWYSFLKKEFGGKKSHKKC